MLKKARELYDPKRKALIQKFNLFIGFLAKQLKTDQSTLAQLGYKSDQALLNSLIAILALACVILASASMSLALSATAFVAEVFKYAMDGVFGFTISVTPLALTAVAIYAGKPFLAVKVAKTAQAYIPEAPKPLVADSLGAEGTPRNDAGYYPDSDAEVETDLGPQVPPAPVARSSTSSFEEVDGGSQERSELGGRSSSSSSPKPGLTNI